MQYWYNSSITKRYKFQNRLKRIGLIAVISLFAFLGIIIGSIAYQGYPAFQKTYVGIDIKISDTTSDRKAVLKALYKRLDVDNRKEKRLARKLLSDDASYKLQKFKKENPGFIGEEVRVWLPASDILDQYNKGLVDTNISEKRRLFKNKHIQWAKNLELTEQIKKEFNIGFFTNADSRDPTQAGIGGALLGSFYTIAVCLVFSIVVGVSAAIYLEEFAPKNRFTGFIEATINNLASVPSIVFGLLGLALLLNIMHLPRSASLTGGIVLGLMSFPTIVIATRSSLKSVPDSLRLAGLGMGATRLQTVLHFILPSALPAIITATIIAMAQAIGETAPLLMIGMVAFIADLPGGITSPATSMPVQIFLWSDVPEAGFVQKTAAAITVLLIIVFVMIAIAGYLRHKIEKKSS